MLPDVRGNYIYYVVKTVVDHVLKLQLNLHFYVGQPVCAFKTILSIKEFLNIIILYLRFLCFVQSKLRYDFYDFYTSFLNLKQY